MRLRHVLPVFLLLTIACREQTPASLAQTIPIDRRVGTPRLDSSFELNDPYVGFGRLPARVAATPPAIRNRFQQDLKALFGADSFGLAQLDSARELLVFHSVLTDSLTAFTLHIADVMAGDRYFLYLKRGAAVSPKPWSWYGPSPERGMPPRIWNMTVLEMDSTGGKPQLAVNEWRHNGDVYYAWIRTLLDIGDGLELTTGFRYEAFSNLPFENPDWLIGRKMSYDPSAESYVVRSTLISGGAERPIGSVTLGREGTDWKIRQRKVDDKQFSKLIWSANPLGENAIFSQLPAVE